MESVAQARFPAEADAAWAAVRDHFYKGAPVLRTSAIGREIDVLLVKGESFTVRVRETTNGSAVEVLAPDNLGRRARNTLITEKNRLFSALTSSLEAGGRFDGSSTGGPSASGETAGGADSRTDAPADRVNDTLVPSRPEPVVQPSGSRFSAAMGGWKQKILDSMAIDPEIAFSGVVDAMGGTLTIYQDGTFATKGVFGAATERDRLISIKHDADSIRRKSVTGRSAAFLATGGASILASNNRGVVYLTIVGARLGAKTWTTRNPSGAVLENLRDAMATGEAVIAQNAQAPRSDRQIQSALAEPAPGLATQLQQLADLHSSGALSDEEFNAAKARLLES